MRIGVDNTRGEEAFTLRVDRDTRGEHTVVVFAAGESKGVTVKLADLRAALEWCSRRAGVA